jgi:hypothetical protein
LNSTAVKASRATYLASLLVQKSLSPSSFSCWQRPCKWYAVLFVPPTFHFSTPHFSQITTPPIARRVLSSVCYSKNWIDSLDFIESYLHCGSKRLSIKFSSPISFSFHSAFLFLVIGTIPPLGFVYGSVRCSVLVVRLVADAAFKTSCSWCVMRLSLDVRGLGSSSWSSLLLLSSAFTSLLLKSVLFRLDAFDHLVSKSPGDHGNASLIRVGKLFAKALTRSRSGRLVTFLGYWPWIRCDDLVMIRIRLWARIPSCTGIQTFPMKSQS